MWFGSIKSASFFGSQLTPKIFFLLWFFIFDVEQTSWKKQIYKIKQHIQKKIQSQILCRLKA